ncbi:MAG: hypothetical protein NT009_06895 [Proteobacteria bacterium]|nr:hypothetical protein [Pseudomonadota bacterium]
MNDDPTQKAPLSFSILLRLAGLGFLSGALIGQLVDFAYPLSGSLHYFRPIWKLESPALEVCWWIPILYGVAGVILVVGYPLLDRRFGQKPIGGFNPSWGFILASILYFVAQFYAGPFLSSTGISHIWTFAFTMLTGLLCWWLFDRTKAGVCMMALTATLGPLLELSMINVLDLYAYTGPDVFGIPLWILGAYICGCPPNGNLGRKYLVYLQRK